MKLWYELRLQYDQLLELKGLEKQELGIRDQAE